MYDIDVIESETLFLQPWLFYTSVCETGQVWPYSICRGWWWWWWVCLLSTNHIWSKGSNWKNHVRNNSDMCMYNVGHKRITGCQNAQSRKICQKMSFQQKEPYFFTLTTFCRVFFSSFLSILLTQIYFIS